MPSHVAPAHRAAFLLAVALLSAAPPLHAGGFHITILGVRRNAMLTNIANPDDVTALFHNPAGLADLRGTRLHLSSGMSFVKPAIRLQALDPERFPEVNPANCGQVGEADCPWPVDSEGYYASDIQPEKYFGVIPYLGGSYDLGQDYPNLEGLVVSLAAYAPGAYGAYLPEEAPSAYYITSALFVVGTATAGAGYRINDMFAVGAHVSFNHMQLTFSQRYSTIDLLTPRGAAPDSTAELGQAVIGDMKLAFGGADQGFSWGLGMLFSPTPWLSFGVSHIGSTAARFRGDLKLSGMGSALDPNPMAPEQLRELITSFGYKVPTGLEVEMPIPPALATGVSFRPSPYFEAGLDFHAWFYTMFKRQVMRPLYNSTDVGIEPLSEANLSKDKHYRNSYEFALGLLARPFGTDELELMAGVGLDTTPVPDATFSIDNPSLNQFIVTAGVRATLGANWRLGVAYMNIHYLKRDIRTSETWPPTNAQVWGSSQIPTLEVEYLF